MSIKRIKQKGFTLVEMSIVLVIIGLIVGGVLVGQDLVKAAQIRAVVSQLQQYDAAINTFRGKYDGMPGDHARASVFISGASSGDGDGKLESAAQAASAIVGQTFDGELRFFWQHLSLANMVGGSYDGTSTDVDLGFPSTKLKKGGIIAISQGSLPLWIVGTGTTISSFTTTGTGAVGNTIAPTEAFGIDNKLDDGNALTGTAYVAIALTTTAFTQASGAPTTTAGSETCWGTTAGDYYLSVERNNCTLVVRMQGS